MIINSTTMLQSPHEIDSINNNHQRVFNNQQNLHRIVSYKRPNMPKIRERDNDRAIYD